MFIEATKQIDYTKTRSFRIVKVKKRKNSNQNRYVHKRSLPEEENQIINESI